VERDAGGDADDAVRIVLCADRPRDVAAMAVAVGVRAAGVVPELDHVQVGMRRVDPRIDHVRVDVRDRAGAVPGQRRAAIGVDLVDPPGQRLRRDRNLPVHLHISDVRVGTNLPDAVTRNDGGVAVERVPPHVVDGSAVLLSVQLGDRLWIDGVLQHDDISIGSRPVPGLSRDGQERSEHRQNGNQQDASTH
jgi:hypothetical protein